MTRWEKQNHGIGSRTLRWSSSLKWRPGGVVSECTTRARGTIAKCKSIGELIVSIPSPCGVALRARKVNRVIEDRIMLVMRSAVHESLPGYDVGVGRNYVVDIDVEWSQNAG